MRCNSAQWSISCGVKQGHYHIQRGLNCQDSAIVIATPTLAIGVGCDGCGEGLHSEVGSSALSYFVAHKLKSLFESGERGVYPGGIFDLLFQSTVHFINSNVALSCSDNPSQVADYIKNYWLSTIFGVILAEDFCYFFWCGDGVFGTEEGIIQIDQHNTPLYIAHNSLLVPRRFGVFPEHIPNFFNVEKIEGQSKVMVASDGFTTYSDPLLTKARVSEPDLPTSLHGTQWEKKGQCGLKKWMNSRSDRGYFDDDCFIITGERIV